MTVMRKKWSHPPDIRAQFHQRVVQAVQSLGCIPVIPLMKDYYLFIASSYCRCFCQCFSVYAAGGKTAHHKT